MTYIKPPSSSLAPIPTVTCSRDSTRCPSMFMSLVRVMTISPTGVISGSGSGSGAGAGAG